MWLFIDADGEQGWIAPDLIGFLGPVDDRISWFVSFYAGYRDELTIEELGETLATAHAASVQELSGNTLVPETRQVKVGVVDSVAEVTFDVIGSNDNASLGVRLHVSADASADQTSFTLRNVERTTICGRGLSASEDCL